MNQPQGFQYTRTPARYAKGMVALRIPGIDGWKSTAACILTFEIAPNARYSGREKSYIVSPRQADRFEAAVRAAIEKIQPSQQASLQPDLFETPEQTFEARERLAQSWNPPFRFNGD